jgi:hypothetical protein
VKRRGILVAILAAAAGVAIVVRGSGEAPAPAPVAAAPSPEAQLAAVERVVEERNRHLGEEARVFEADGWQMVAADPPDSRLTELDPTLIAEGRERELRVQLASTTGARRHVRNLGRIIMTAELPETREAATEALGRIKSDLAKHELIEILTSGKLAPDDLGRRQIAAHLRPDDLDADIAPRIADLLDSPKLTAGEKEQIAYNLALVGLRDGMTLPDAVLATLSDEARALISRMTEIGGTAFLAHTHRH